MSLNRSLADLKNIGKKIVGRLNEVGIFSEDDLKRVGAVEVHRLIRERHPGESLPVCYYLYSFEGALTDKHWGEIGAPRKHQLKTQIGHHNTAQDGNSATFHYPR